jgi:Zn ribbon nucleic-acid-binding protein
MGLPTRLHGDVVVDFAGAVKDFCPRCISIKEWVIVCNDGKYYKSCIKCGLKREINRDELKKLTAKAKAEKAKAEGKSKGKK